MLTMKTKENCQNWCSKSKQNETNPLKYRGSKTEPLTNNQKNKIYINESGLYSLILRSKLESARAFKRWVTKEVLPSIRKTGKYSSTLFNDDMNHKYNDKLTFKIENETDLHTKVVSFLKKRYPNSIFAATLGENQDSSKKRVDSDKKAYLRGSPDNLQSTISTSIKLDWLPSLKAHADKGFCHMIKLRCCDSIKTIVFKNSYE